MAADQSLGGGQDFLSTSRDFGGVWTIQPFKYRIESSSISD